MWSIWFDLFTTGLYCIHGYFAFYKLHRPESPARRKGLIAAMILGSALVILGIPRLYPYINDKNNLIILAGVPLILALICGDLRRTLFTVVYLLSASVYLNNTIFAFMTAITGYYPFAEQRLTLAFYIVRGTIRTLIALWAYFYYRIMRKYTGKPPLSLWLLGAAPPIVGVLIYEYALGVAITLFEKGENIFLVLTLPFTLLGALNLFVFYMYVRLMASYEERLKTQSLQSELESQKRQNALIAGAQKQAAEIRHEMKNLLFALQIELDRGNSEGVKTRIAALLGELKQYELKPYTTVPVIDAMIAYKGETLREGGADFSVRAEPLCVSDDLAYDIASLLAIALDNAADAALSPSPELVEGRQADDCPPFTVRLVISRRKNLVFILVSNPLTRPLKWRGDEPQSTKEEPGHGLGLPALRRIVERHSGEVRIADKEGLFLLEVMLTGSGE